MARIVFLTVLVALVASAAQAQPAGDVDLPRFELGAGVSLYHMARGATISVDGNLSDRIAIATEVERTFNRAASLLTGPRASTGFYYSGDAFPGRFFAQLLAGVQRSDGGPARVTLQPGVGADVIAVRSRGVSLHWEIGYHIVPGAGRNPPGGRVVLGLVFGPHVVAGRPRI